MFVKMELCDLLSKIDPLSASYILQGKLQNIKSLHLIRSDRSDEKTLEFFYIFIFKYVLQGGVQYLYIYEVVISVCLFVRS